MAITISGTTITFSDSTTLAVPTIPTGFPSGGGLYIGIVGASWHLFACTKAQEITAQWKTTNTNTANTNSTTDGLANSNSMNNAAHPAAYYCRTTMNGSGGFSDWYLPAIDETYLFHLNRNYFDGTLLSYYWSSTQDPNDTANAQDRLTNLGTIMKHEKTTSTFGVRPVRRQLL